MVFGAKLGHFRHNSAKISPPQIVKIGAKSGHFCPEIGALPRFWDRPTLHGDFPGRWLDYVKMLSNTRAGVDNLPNAPIFIGERYKVIVEGYKNYSHSVVYY